jgi:hypothetical protein
MTGFFVAGFGLLLRVSGMGTENGEVRIRLGAVLGFVGCVAPKFAPEPKPAIFYLVTMLICIASCYCLITGFNRARLK